MYEDIEKKIFDNLKDFQVATVTAVDDMFWTEPKQKRVLVADEVGLGKTLIAKASILKFAQHFFENSDKETFNVIYVCSNSSISNQNLKKLAIEDICEIQDTTSSRLPLLQRKIYEHAHKHNGKNIKKINLIPITPGTSFNITAGYGISDERKLMFVALQEVKKLTGEDKNRLSNFFEKGAPSAWSSIDNERAYILDQCGEEYIEYLKQNFSQLLDMQIPESFYNKIKKNELKRQNHKYTYWEAIDEELDPVIRYLRYEFARLSLKILKPDFVIMDEFQRFKDLLDLGNSNIDETDLTEQQLLAKTFFDNNHVLLLSATPYKLYSSLDEININQTDEHYSEFLNVIKFLKDEKIENFETIWKNYSASLATLKTETKTGFIKLKRDAEKELRQNISRTERISFKNKIDMIKEIRIPIEITESDIKSFLEAQNVLDKLNQSNNILEQIPFYVDYVKSCPYLLSFMRKYKFKTNLEELDNNIKHNFNSQYLWLDRKTINDYQELPTRNARLTQLITDAFSKKAEKLLWVTPSFPYYPLRGDFAGTENFSKLLVFSSWEMVPRMISCLVSYEAERRIFTELNKNSKIKYFANNEENDSIEDDEFESYDDDEVIIEGDKDDIKKSSKKRYPPSRLNFAKAKGKIKPSAMALLAFMYPSLGLQDLYKPYDRIDVPVDTIIKEIAASLKKKINGKFKSAKLPEKVKMENTWFFIIPFLLDDKERVKTWIQKQAELSVFDGDEKKEKKKEKQEGFKAHLNKLETILNNIWENNFEDLGPLPEDTVYELVAKLAIASPAICINRSYEKYLLENCSFDIAYPSQIAKLFIDRMNTPESTAVIMTSSSSDKTLKMDDHWKNLLAYSVDGNLQALFDEYCHILVSGISKGKNTVKDLHHALGDSFKIKNTPYLVDTFENFISAESSNKTGLYMRSHFAVSFTKGDSSSQSDVDRKTTVRNAFNSPFRPFVLASTSIGQEGLDFHNYCRRILHWNLPHNPIDLEQREGRINRYKCLAVRQNVVNRYAIKKVNEPDIWDELFHKAEKKEKQSSTQMVPYWGLKKEPYEGAKELIPIERLVYEYPFSIDAELYVRLMKVLSLYRMTLGQTRQEELVNYLLNEKIDGVEELFINLCPKIKL